MQLLELRRLRRVLKAGGADEDRGGHAILESRGGEGAEDVPTYVAGAYDEDAKT